MEVDDEGFTVVQGDEGGRAAAKSSLAIYNLARGMLQVVRHCAEGGIVALSH